MKTSTFWYVVAMICFMTSTLVHSYVHYYERSVACTSKGLTYSYTYWGGCIQHAQGAKK